MTDKPSAAESLLAYMYGNDAADGKCEHWPHYPLAYEYHPCEACALVAIDLALDAAGSPSAKPDGLTAGAREATRAGGEPSAEDAVAAVAREWLSSYRGADGDPAERLANLIRRQREEAAREALRWVCETQRWTNYNKMVAAYFAERGPNAPAKGGTDATGGTR